MKIFLDTNILLSAALFPNGVAAKAYFKAVSYPNKSVTSQWNIDELYRVFARKFPEKTDSLNRFFSVAKFSFEIIPTPDTPVSDETKIRDVNDRPILRAAQKSCASILLTGDKDFLESGIDDPLILNPSQFIDINEKMNTF